jgi:hypothetical protein
MNLLLSVLLTSPEYDLVNGLSDLGINCFVDNNGVVQIVGTASPSEMIPVAQVKQVPDVTPQHNSTGLVGAIKKIIAILSLLNQQNVILDNHSKLLKI